jgi:hypothetical protein
MPPGQAKKHGCNPHGDGDHDRDDVVRHRTLPPTPRPVYTRRAPVVVTQPHSVTIAAKQPVTAPKAPAPAPATQQSWWYRMWHRSSNTQPAPTNQRK